MNQPPEALASALDESALGEIVARSGTCRVLHVINGEFYAGAERVQDTLALRLPAEGFEVGFAALKSGQFAASRHSQASSLDALPMRGRLDLRAAWGVARLIRARGYRLLHSHSPRGAMVARLAARWAGVPWVHHLHTETPVEVGRAWVRRASAWIERHSLRQAAGLIAVSPGIERFLRAHGYSARRIWVVPNGVPGSEEPFRQRVDPRVWIVGTVALFRPRKGLEVLLEAVARLRQSGLPVQARVVGPFETADDEERVRALAERLGIARATMWRGFCRDVAAELRGMDIFVLPSLLSEGLPMSVLEAMALGTTVVGSRVAGLTDVVRDGEEGLLVEPGSAEDLARVLSLIVRGQADTQSLRSAARCRQQALFSDRSMAAGVARAYRELLGPVRDRKETEGS